MFGNNTFFQIYELCEIMNFLFVICVRLATAIIKLLHKSQKEMKKQA